MVNHLNYQDKVFIAGHKGLLGSALVGKLISEGYVNILTATRDKVDLTQSSQVYDFFDKNRPKYVFLAAAKVGGLFYNKNFPADFLRENILIQTNVIDAAYRFGCKKLLFVGSACVYPKNAESPISESSFMAGDLDPTNISYAMSKIIGYIMCKKYYEQYGFNCISVMPNNIYGINDNFDTQTGHVVASFIARFSKAKKNNLLNVTCFGDGSPFREFIFADDLADALFFLMNNYDEPDLINVGTNKEISIKHLASKIANIVGYQGDIIWDISKPNGVGRRLLDTSKLNKLGWTSKISLDEGLSKTFEWYNQQEIYK